MAPKGRKVARGTFGLILQQVQKLVFDPSYITSVGALLFFAELVINIFIIRRVKYTEIDWSTYMQQVTLYENGERDYSKIGGSTGPLVYPALHVYIFSALKWICDGGENILRAQWCFMWLYLLNLVIVVNVYKKVRGIQPWHMVLMFVASHRIHSIFVLRLFNDPVCMLFAYSCVWALTNQQWLAASVLFGMALNIKMNILLFAPGFAYIFYNHHGFIKSAVYGSFTAVTTVLLGLPFLLHNWQSYVAGAFNFGRQFEFKWTVNFRFLSEDVFHSRVLHTALLAVQLCALVYFLASKWHRAQKVDATQMVLIMFSSNFIGMMCSRSLHYQFLAWYHHTLPALVFAPKIMKPLHALLVLGCIEFCWNMYPSTNFSSALLHISHLVVFGSLAKYGWEQEVAAKVKKTE